MSEVAPAAPAVEVTPGVASPAPSTAAPAAPAEGAPSAQNTAEQAPAAKPEGEKPDAAKTDQDPEKRNSSRRFERRLDKAYRRAAEAEARATVLERQLSERSQAQAQSDPNAPKLENFSDIEKYAEAKAKYESDKTLQAHTAKQRGEAQKQAQAKLVEGWEGKVERADEKYEDFQAVVGDIQPTSPWAIALMEAENGEDIAYWLGKNIKEAERIAQLSPQAQFREIGKLEAKLLAAPPKAQQPSRAPAPVAPLTGTSPANSTDYKPGMPMDDYMKLREKKGWSARRR